MKPGLTKSSFSSVYLRLGIIAAACVGVIIVLSQAFVAPRLVKDRAESALSLFRSHEEDILLGKTRAIRDELLEMGLMARDQDFEAFLFEEKVKVKSLLQDCSFISPSICLGSKASIFLNGNSKKPAFEQFNFAVLLKGNLSSPNVLYFWEFGGAFIVLLAFFLLYRSIRKKEQLLLGQINFALGAFEEVKDLFGEKDHSSEFDQIRSSTKDLVKALAEAKKIIEDYKAKFERRTRLEQLGQTIGQISHDFKAPLNEAENFLVSLPLLLEKVSKEQLQEAIDSLVLRIRSGKEALSLALQETKKNTVARDPLDLRELLLSIQNRARQNKVLERLSIKFQLEEGLFSLGDRQRLETAILNLLENTAEEKADALVAVSLLKNDSGMAKIIYEDDGGGIPQEHLDKVFEPLVTFKSKGSGLGLSSTREILSQHGGKIAALPKLGGAKFEILLPTLRGAHA